jgi:hypothetical protein
MMNKPESLLKRLDEIGNSISKKEGGLALIGLGSVGLETNRLDEFSDLDFYVITATDNKIKFLEDLAWLTDIAPAAYYFKNTQDGYKFLFEDGIFCEFAVFEEQELEQIVFSPGRVIWKAASVDSGIAIPKAALQNTNRSQTVEWLLGEALTNLYVGLMRDQRGEKLTAMRFIQVYAADRILELSTRTQQVDTSHQADIFNLERRYEKRYPQMTKYLPGLLQGYEHNRASARAALFFLDEHFEISPAMKKIILELSEPES